MSQLPEAAPRDLLGVLDSGGSARVAAADLAGWDPEQWCRTTGRRLILLDTLDCATGKDLIQAFDEAFDLPEECADWDQLDECLGDYDVSPDGGLLVVWSGWDSVASDDERAMATAVDALVTAAQAWRDDGVAWSVLIVGDGPSWDLPWVGAGAPPWPVDLTDGDMEEPVGYDDFGADSIGGYRW